MKTTSRKPGAVALVKFERLAALVFSPDFAHLCPRITKMNAVNDICEKKPWHDN